MDWQGLIGGGQHPRDLLRRSKAFESQKPDSDRIYDISQIDFDRLRQEFAKSERKNTTVQILKHVLEDKLQVLLMQNP